MALPTLLFLPFGVYAGVMFNHPPIGKSCIHSKGSRLIDILGYIGIDSVRMALKHYLREASLTFILQEEESLVIASLENVVDITSLSQ